MSNFIDKYKKKPLGFANVSQQRVFRAIQHEKERKKQRAAKFDGNRMISDESKETRKEEVPAATKPDRTARLLRWKQEKEKQKRLQQVKKKPAFVVGVVHHKIYSPVVKDAENAKHKPCLHQMKRTHVPKPDSVPKRVTKATEKRLQSKAIENKTNAKAPFKKPTAMNGDKKDKKLEQTINVSSSKVKSTEEMPVRLFGRVTMESMTPITRKSHRSPIVEISKLKNSITNDLIQPVDSVTTDAKDDMNCTDDSSIEAVALHLSSDEISNDNGDDSNERKINNSIGSNRSLSDSMLEPVFYSPYVVSSRGKDNARKEQQLKRGFSLGRSPKDDIPTKETVMKNLNISIEDEERTAQYFQFLLNREIERLNELCDKWAKIQSEPETTEDGRYEINQAIGQTNLLMNKKFERFRRLVADCETGKGEMLVTCKDLQGFWDMMYMEIENCNERFEKLEKLRLLRWEQVESPARKPVVKKRTAVKKKVAPTRSSTLRNFLARKRMANEAKIDESTEAKTSPEKNGNRSMNDKFTRRSLSTNPSPMKSTSKRSSLLRKVQLSENSKKMKSPLTIMKISQMCKTPVVMLDDTITYINSDQTPAKSILKQSKNSAETESRKLPNKVNFDDQVISKEVPIDEETQVKLSLAAALTRIDSLDLDSQDELVINAERKLNFDDCLDEREDNDITSNNDLSKSSSDSEKTEKQPQESKRIRNTPRKSIRRQNAVDAGDEKLDKTGNVEDVTLLSHGRTSTPFKEIKSDVNALEQDLAIAKDEINAHDGSIRILRNRTIPPAGTPSSRKSKKVNKQEPESKENEIPQRRRKSSVAINSDINEESKEVTPIDNGSESTKRRSTRNVKFSESEDNNRINKPALPMTPHVRSSRKSSRKSLSVDNSQSLEVPEKLPERVRRSQTRRSTMKPQIDA